MKSNNKYLISIFFVIIKKTKWVKNQCVNEKMRFYSVVNWNSIILDGTVPDEEIKGMIEESYLLTKKKPKKESARKPCADARSLQ